MRKPVGLDERITTDGTTDFEQIKQRYYGVHRSINLTGGRARTAAALGRGIGEAEAGASRAA